MPFWTEKPLSRMSREEWESLCDHCGKCCLLKLQDEDETSEVEYEDEDSVSQTHNTPVEHTVYYTDIVCDLFDQQSGHCTDYWNRETRVPGCLRLTRKNLDKINWLPPSCAYRRIMEGRGLPDWHHLVSGDKRKIHETGHSVQGKVVYEKDIDQNDVEEHIVTWPLDD